MTYTLRRTADDNYDLEREDGTVVTSLSPPVTTPDDIVDAILDDMGIVAPQKEAFKLLFKQDWEIIDGR